MIRIYDSGYRGECNSEDGDQMSCMEWIKHHHPNRWPLVFHCPNELTVDKKKRGYALHLDRRKRKGVKPGIPDTLDLNGPIVGAFELKKKDKNQTSVTKSQRDVLAAVSASGGFAAICYGYEQFVIAYSDYLEYCAAHGVK